MVASGRGLDALPRWLAQEYAEKLPISVARLGKKGIAKKIYLGTRKNDNDIEYLKAFIKLARNYPIETQGRE